MNGIWSECPRQNVNDWSAIEFCVWGLVIVGLGDFFYWLLGDVIFKYSLFPKIAILQSEVKTPKTQ